MREGDRAEIELALRQEVQMKRPRIWLSAKLGEAFIQFVGLVLVASAVVKFLHPDKPVAYMRYLGYEHDTLFVIAVIELLTGILFLLPYTRAAGLPLVSSYFGGAIAAHLANHPYNGGGPFLTFNANHHYLGTLPALILLLGSWLGVLLRHPQSRWSFTDTKVPETLTDNTAIAARTIGAS